MVRASVSALPLRVSSSKRACASRSRFLASAALATLLASRSPSDRYSAAFLPRSLLMRAKANIDEVDAVFLADLFLQPREQTIVKSAERLVDASATRLIAGIDADEIVHPHLADGGPELAVDARPENRPRPFRRPHAT